MIDFGKEKGYLGVDIAISVIIIFIFVSIIASLIYSSNSKAKEIEYKTVATEIAVEEIENVKAQGFEAYESLNTSSTQDEYGNNLAYQETTKEGFFKTITVTDYSEIEGKEYGIPNIVKKVTVKVEYMFKGKAQLVELSTILSKEK